MDTRPAIWTQHHCDKDKAFPGFISKLLGLLRGKGRWQVGCKASTTLIRQDIIPGLKNSINNWRNTSWDSKAILRQNHNWKHFRNILSVETDLHCFPRGGFEVPSRIAELTNQLQTSLLTRFLPQGLDTWWFQPIWKICSPIWVTSPKGENQKCLKPPT